MIILRLLLQDFVNMEMPKDSLTTNKLANDFDQKYLNLKFCLITNLLNYTVVHGRKANELAAQTLGYRVNKTAKKSYNTKIYDLGIGKRIEKY